MKFLHRMPTPGETEYLLLLKESDLLALGCAALSYLHAEPDDGGTEWAQGVIDTLEQVRGEQSHLARRLAAKLRKALSKRR